MCENQEILYIFKLCREHGKFVHEVFPEMFGPEFTVEEWAGWQAYDSLTVCQRYSIDPTDYDDMNEVVGAIERSRAKEQLKWKRISEGS